MGKAKTKKAKKAASKSKRKVSKSAQKSPKMTAAANKRPLGSEISLKGIVQFIENPDNYTRIKYKKAFDKRSFELMKRGKNLLDLAREFKIHRTTIREWSKKYPSFSNAIIKGVAEFVRSLPPKLIDHMTLGKSFESFAGICGRGTNWLYDLERVYPDFAQAKAIGRARSLGRWEEIAQSQAMGTLRRISKEIIRTNATGETLVDPRTGEPLKDIHYVPSLGSDRALIFSMQNRFEEYRPDKEAKESELFADLKEVLDANEADENANKYLPEDT